MRKMRCIVFVLCCFVSGNVFAAGADFESRLAELSDAIDKYMEAKDGWMPLLMDAAKLKVEISAIVSSDCQAKALMIKEIQDIPAKEFVETDNASKVRTERYLYHYTLLEILGQVDENESLNYVKQVSKSKRLNDSFKMNCLRLIDSLRMSHIIKSPDILKQFDLRMKEIYLNVLNPQNGITERYKLMSIKRTFISHLLGYELLEGKVKIPAADKALGLKLARDVVDEKIDFINKRSFMKEFAKYDPYILGKYLAGLREYTYNEDIGPEFRLEFARELGKHEKVKKGLIEELEKEAKSKEQRAKSSQQ